MTQHILLSIRGMTCAACVGRVERALGKAPGVARASVNYATETATVESTPDASLNAEQLVALVHKAGYEAQVHSPGASAPEEAPPTWWAVWGPASVALALSLPLMLPMLWGQHDFWPAWWQFAVATPVQFVLGARFYRGAWAALKDGSGHMDQLVALGTTAAWGLSCWLWWQASAGQGGHQGHEGMAMPTGTAHPPMLYFESSAMVIALVLLGKALEARAKRQTTQAIRALQALRPDVVHRLGPQGEVEVPLAQVLVGDVLRIRPGERIPADALITEGQSHVDEALLTGEPLPVRKAQGMRVTGGSINGEGVLTVRVTAVGAQTMLAHIIQSVVEAQAGKAPIQRLVDRVSAVFVPTVLVIALLTGLAWWWHGLPVDVALMRAVAVLVIACPCALGLATPAAIMAGTGAAARQGILIKDPQALESAQAVRTVAFDKTGTLTQGQPTLLALECQGDQPGPEGRQQALAVAAGMQTGSEHPLARAVLRAAGSEGVQALPARQVQAVAGRGMSAELQGAEGWHTWRLGSTAWARLALGDAALSPEQEARLAHWASQGASVSWLMQQVGAGPGPGECSWRLTALLAFGDQVKPGAAQAVAMLKAQGIRTVLISGDNQGAAQAIGLALGLDEVVAEVLPGDKAQHIRRLQANLASEHGHRVAMVGDGLNDAPALAAADVAMAMANPQGGTDVAMHTAGITLMRGDPMLVPAALDIARQTAARIRQNLFWAFAYNVVGIPLAAMGGLNPMLAGAAMAMSSVSVLLNALRLTRWRPKQAAGAR